MPVILDGEVQRDILYRTNRDEIWLEDQLIAHQLSSAKDVFYAAITDQGEFTILKKGKDPGSLPPIQH